MELLAGVQRLGLDTSPVIYFIEDHPKYLDRVKRIFDRIDVGDLEAVTSTITLCEVLVQPLKQGNAVLASRYGSLLRNSRHFRMLPIDAAVAERASELRVRYRLRTPDALQLGNGAHCGLRGLPDE